jgi:hypothetical protein
VRAVEAKPLAAASCRVRLKAYPSRFISASRRVLVAPVDTENRCAHFELREVGLLRSEDSRTTDATAEQMAEEARRYARAFALGKSDAERRIVFVGHGMKWRSTDKQSLRRRAARKAADKRDLFC